MVALKHKNQKCSGESGNVFFKQSNKFHNSKIKANIFNIERTNFVHTAHYVIDIEETNWCCSILVTYLVLNQRYVYRWWQRITFIQDRWCSIPVTSLNSKVAQMDRVHCKFYFIFLLKNHKQLSRLRNRDKSILLENEATISQQNTTQVVS